MFLDCRPAPCQCFFNFQPEHRRQANGQLSQREGIWGHKFSYSHTKNKNVIYIRFVARAQCVCDVNLSSLSRSLS